MKSPKNLLFLSFTVFFFSNCQNQPAEKEEKEAVQTEATPEKMEKPKVDLKGAGLVSLVGDRTFDETYERLKTSIEENPNLKIVAELDHSQNAQNAEMQLNPTKIVFFGNPKMGTPLMQNSQSVGLDLPQKMLVMQAEDGTVKILYNDPMYLVERHNISGNDEILKKMSGALKKLAEGAGR